MKKIPIIKNKKYKNNTFLLPNVFLNVSCLRINNKKKEGIFCRVKRFFAQSLHIFIKPQCLTD